MLKTQLLHPEILSIIARGGHHSRILIADGNYPASSTMGPNAKLVSLQLMPNVPTVTQVLSAILATVPIERANTMDYERTGPYALTEDPPVWPQFRQAIKQAGLKLELEAIEKWEFYKAVNNSDHILTIQTADQQRFANLLLTIGVRMD